MATNKSEKGVDRYGWVVSKGSCGYNVDGPVYARRYHSIALFAFQGRSGFWTCSVTGVMSCGGETLEECMIAGEKAACDSKQEDRDSWMSEEHFSETIRDETILGFTSEQ